MYVFLEITGIRFAWHDRKLSINERKHGVSLEEAAEAYLDPDALFVSPGEGHIDGREALIGRPSRAKTLFVVHLIEDNEQVLIISARPATKEEKMRYETKLY